MTTKKDNGSLDVRFAATGVLVVVALVCAASVLVLALIGVKTLLVGCA